MVRYACVSLIGTAISLLSLVSLAWGGFNEGVAAYNRGDYPTAYREFLPLAQRGDARAQANVGRLYHEGHGVPQDYAEAVKWFRKAADQGYTGSQFQLGSLYYQGHGVPRDYAEAVKWYRKAAEQGDDGAQAMLGTMYARGEGVPQDYVQAHMWINLAASQSPPGELHKEAVKWRDSIAARMTPAQIAEAQRLAREWKPKQP
jgi:TPR repeat protein